MSANVRPGSRVTAPGARADMFTRQQAGGGRGPVGGTSSPFAAGTSFVGRTVAEGGRGAVGRAATPFANPFAGGAPFRPSPVLPPSRVAPISPGSSGRGPVVREVAGSARSGGATAAVVGRSGERGFSWFPNFYAGRPRYYRNDINERIHVGFFSAMRGMLGAMFLGSSVLEYSHAQEEARRARAAADRQGEGGDVGDNIRRVAVLRGKIADRTSRSAKADLFLRVAFVACAVIAFVGAVVGNPVLSLIGVTMAVAAFVGLLFKLTTDDTEEENYNDFVQIQHLMTPKSVQD